MPWDDDGGRPINPDVGTAAAMTDRCPICDRPIATDEQWRATMPPRSAARSDLCWDGYECRTHAVDWRARAMKAEAELAAARLQRRDITKACSECGSPADALCMGVTECMVTAGGNRG